MGKGVFEAFAYLTLDSKGFDQGLSDADKKFDSFGSKLMKGLGGVGVAVGAGITAAATGIAALTKSAVEGYAEYEQLEGGVKKLFGEGADQLLSYSKKAYETAGMSANDYIQNVTGFSAALINSLGGDTKKAAEVADMAMRDISDNANTYGTYSAQQLAGVYQALAKGQFQTLDNLNLGYGGTKEGMEQLIRKAEELDSSFSVTHTKSKKGVDEITYSYADMIQAIHIVQENMNIAGTTQKEAAGTIQGSLNMTKAAWDNLLVGLADGNADLGELINDVISSGEAALENLIPVAEKAVTSIASAIEKIVPIITKKLPELVQKILPPILKAATSIVNSIVKALPQLIKVLIDEVPGIINTIIDTALKMLPDIIKLGLDLIIALADGIARSLPELIPVVVDVILKIVEILTNPDSIRQLIEASFQIISALAEGLLDALPEIIAAVPEIVINIVEALISELPTIINTGLELFTALVDKLPEIIENIVSAVKKIGKAIIQAFKDHKRDIVEAGKNLLKGLWEGISNTIGWLKDKVTNVAKSIIGWVKGAFDENSPSKVFADIGENLGLGLGEGYEESMRQVGRDIQKISEDAIPTIKAPEFSESYGYGSNSRFGSNRGGYGYGSGDIIINIDGSGLTVDEIASQLGTAVRRQIRLNGAFA